MRVILFDDALAQLATGWQPPCGRPLLALLATAHDRRPARDAVRAAACTLAARWVGSAQADYLRPDRLPRIVADGADFLVSLAYGNGGNSGDRDDGCALIALAPASGHGLAALGVDLCMNTLPDDWDDIARLYFAPSVRAALAKTEPQHRAEAFAQAWSQLEACNKAACIDLTEWHSGLATVHGQITTISPDLPAFFANGWRAALALILAPSRPIAT
ncbi:4'-phosphopantetheinyl transferase superfamily protein [Jeongeupia naejangsanensis]|uniref:4'-phosphopantetheinyl transferase superfamily protein n=1 Tax=Jeongeupia naejangsanensis TaxID=613195 RepID=A0ABS2BIT3_9NEIS|nr:4'-phosphopantetheinyl transferase superfamily protein [Jeongeupia naejangsanensis]MBM3115013.1 4'-phosphopantetheinyl transferase superfamily protein [Jeongeupia naejangsanensis]